MLCELLPSLGKLNFCFLEYSGIWGEGDIVYLLLVVSIDAEMWIQRANCIHIRVQPIFRTFLSCKTNSILIKQIPISTLSQPLAISTQLSISVSLTALDTSYKWNHTAFILSRLAHFSWIMFSLRFTQVVACIKSPFLMIN